MKKDKYMLSIKQRTNASNVVAICAKAEKVYGDTEAQCNKLFRAEFVSRAHINEAAHWNAYGKALRPEGKTTYAYRLFLKWTHAQLGEGKPLPGQSKKRSAKYAVSPLVIANAFHQRIEGLQRDVKRMEKGDAISVATIRTIAALVKQLLDADKAVTRDAQETVEAAQREAA